MRLINNIKHRKEEKRQAIARPYVSEAVGIDRARLLAFFTKSRAIDKANIIKRLDDIKFDKPWPKGTTLDQAFELAIHEAIAIVEHELRD